jgi:hypothetical protein
MASSIKQRNKLSQTTTLGALYRPTIIHTSPASLHRTVMNAVKVLQGDTKKTGSFEMRSGSHVQLAALRNRDLELQTTSPFSNHGSVER